jgi:hypothetical protein
MNAYTREVSNLSRVGEDAKVRLDEGHGRGLGRGPCTIAERGRVVGFERDDDTKDGTAGLSYLRHTHGRIHHTARGCLFQAHVVHNMLWR